MPFDDSCTLYGARRSVIESRLDAKGLITFTKYARAKIDAASN
jgi:hypothetical protein